MNYLDLINNVLRRMRENPVTSIYENAQSTVVADLINDAKRQCEEAHSWTCLQTDLSVPVALGTSTYSLTGTQQRAEVLDVRNITSGSFLNYVPNVYMRQQELVNDIGNGQPRHWTHYGIDSSGDTQIKVWPSPDTSYNLRFWICQRQADLAAAGDNLTIPHMPVIHMAHVLAATERGDVDSSDVSTLSALAKRSLADAISHDMGRQPENNIWYAQ